MVKSTLNFPPIYLLDAHIPTSQLHDLEDQIPTLTYDIKEARIILGKVGTKQRAQFELRKRNLYTLELGGDKIEKVEGDGVVVKHEARPVKKRKIDVAHAYVEVVDLQSDTESDGSDASSLPHKAAAQVTTPVLKEHDDDNDGQGSDASASGDLSKQDPQSSSAIGAEQTKTSIENDIVKVVKLSWFADSVQAETLLPLDSYLVYEGSVTSKPETTAPIHQASKGIANPREILLRAQNDAPSAATTTAPDSGNGYRKHERTHPFVLQGPHAHSSARPVHLLHQTTSEHDDPTRLPPLPSYLHTVYSCQRPAPSNPPNQQFIELLKKIRHHRKLTFDEIGVRAYSSAIASIAAYPYLLTSSYEITRLPGCDDKIAHLFQEWTDDGKIKAVEEIELDPKHKILDHFWNIWGCAEKTANEFYSNGYVDLDDVVQHEWKQLNRSQQIGVKFYDEFLLKIPRQEVTEIGDIILAHANALTPGFQMCIVGGYRRGKSESGDVDVVLSHPDETVTQDFIAKIDDVLYKSGWITHSLTISNANSERGQMPVAWKGDNTKHGSGFDTLDKALVVWQNPSWPTKEADLATNPQAKNPNVHRRVDIIISPWKTAGCAVMGWTSGTTFNRDLRRYCRKEKGLKFDSSGIRSDEDGSWVDFESGVDGDLVEKEKAVFKGLGLEWREPDMRCTN